MKPKADIWDVLFIGPGHVKEFEGCPGAIPGTIEDLTFLLHLANCLYFEVQNGYRAQGPITLPASPIKPARIPGILEIYLREKCGWQVSLNDDGSIWLAPMPED